MVTESRKTQSQGILKDSQKETSGTPTNHPSDTDKKYKGE